MTKLSETAKYLDLRRAVDVVARSVKDKDALAELGQDAWIDLEYVFFHLLDFHFGGEELIDFNPDDVMVCTKCRQPIDLATITHGGSRVYFEALERGRPEKHRCDR